MEKYPDTFPTPLIEPYGIDVGLGLSTVRFESGRTRQRRVFSGMDQVFSFSFALELTELDAWQRWVDAHAFEYFEITATSYIGKCAKHVVRFASNLTVEPLTGAAVTVSVIAQQAESGTFYTPPDASDVWVVGGTPPAPSPDWIVAGTPPRPSPDWIVAGTPHNPSAHA